MLKYVWLPEYDAGAPIPTNSLIWWEQFLMTEESPGKVALGAYNVRNSSNIR